jgi:serine phosphatase RsbU (regulator of sigma subunit)/CheY-like chemotaxis protein
MTQEVNPARATGVLAAEPSVARREEIDQTTLPAVLLVDDDPDILRIVQFYLKKQKYQVYTATDGEEALAVLEKHPEIELVLSDVMMPGVSGLDLLKAIRADTRRVDLSVLLISAEGQTAKKVAGLELGADDYITKPFNFDELMARVRNHIRLRRLQREVMQKNDLLRAKNEQFLRDLEAARNVQLALMPSQFPESTAYRVGARYIPLEQVGGDFFDVVVLDGASRLGLFIADVCGHGIAAAFVTAMTKLSFRNACFTTDDPGELLSQMNRELLPLLQGGFITVFYAVVDVPSLSMRYASGGHPPLLVRRRGRAEIIELPPQATFLGTFEQVRYASSEFHFEKGDRLLFCTDGLLDGQNGEGHPFGIERVSRLMMEHGEQPIQELINLLVFKLFDYMGNASLEDDITLLGLEIRA